MNGIAIFDEILSIYDEELALVHLNNVNSLLLHIFRDFTYVLLCTENR